MNQSLCLGRAKAQFYRTAASGGQTQYNSTQAQGKRPFLHLGKRNQYTEHKTFRLGSEGAMSTPGRCQAAPHWGLFGTAGEPTNSPHPMGAIHGEDAAALAQRRHSNDPFLHARNGSPVMSQGGAAASLDRARAVPTSSISHLIPAAATRAHPSAGCWDIGMSDCLTVVLLWAEEHNTGPLWED